MKLPERVHVLGLGKLDHLSSLDPLDLHPPVPRDLGQCLGDSAGVRLSFSASSEGDDGPSSSLTKREMWVGFIIDKIAKITDIFRKIVTSSVAGTGPDRLLAEGLS